MGNPTALQCVTLRGGSPVMMARVDDHDGTNLTQAAVASVAYTVSLLDEDYPDNPNTRTAVDNHEAVAVAVADCIYDVLQTGAPWDSAEDETGYNFKWQIDVLTDEAFSIAGRSYVVEWTITPTSGQVIRFDFQPDVE